MILCVAALVVVGCSHEIEEPISFEEVSEPYRETYGDPEEVQRFTSGDDYETIDWWWWSQGFEVTFSNTPYDGVYGWCVSSTFSFAPIIGLYVK